LAFLFKAGVSEVERQQQLGVHGQRYFVERRGKQGLVVAVEGSHDGMRLLDRLDRFQYQQAELGGLCRVHRSIGCCNIAGTQPLIPGISKRHQNKLRTI
jgi:hypothetical protein